MTSKPIIDSHALQNRRVHKRVKPQFIVRHAEVDDAEPGAVALVWWGLNDTVNGGFVITSREKFQAIPRINHLVKKHDRVLQARWRERTYNRVVNMFDPTPLSIGRKDLES